jgi:hypothetical protein
MAKALNILDFSMAGNGSFQLPVEGSYFRILTATGNVAVIGDTFGKLGPINRGQGLENTPFRRLTIQDVSGSANSGTILVSEENFIDQTLYGSITLGAAVAIDSASQLGIKRPEAQTGSFADISTTVANTPITVFTPAANVNGAILLTADLGFQNSGVGAEIDVFITKASAPTSIVDGSIILVAMMRTPVTSASVGYATLQSPQFIAPGQGLYFISNVGLAANNNNIRAARYRLL